MSGASVCAPLWTRSRDIRMGRLSGFRALVIGAAVLLAGWRTASAQGSHPPFDAGGQIVAASLEQFDGSDFGFGGRFAWHPLALLGVEAELDLYPGEFPEGRAFSRRRVEGLFGVTAGPRFDRVRLFGKLRAGFLRVGEAPRPFACILIFPPPLACTLAAGHTLACDRCWWWHRGLGDAPDLRPRGRRGPDDAVSGPVVRCRRRHSRLVRWPRLPIFGRRRRALLASCGWISLSARTRPR